MSAVATFRTPSRTPEGSYDWEDLPSLSSVVVLHRPVPQSAYALAAELVEEARARRRAEPSASPVWLETMPAILDPLIPSSPLADTRIDGLAAREIVEPEVFRHFFGDRALKR